MNTASLQSSILSRVIALVLFTPWMAFADSSETLRVIQTATGPIPSSETGLMLPHEHIFTDLRGPSVPDYGQADPDDVVRVMKPYLDAASSRGVAILVECTSVGVGRNAALMARMDRETGVRIMVPTGVYGRGNFAPPPYQSMSEIELRDWMIKEITEGIDDTGVKAGFIKLACDTTPLTDFQKRQLRAAAQASLQTGAAIAIHTPSGARATEQADILEAQGLPLNRFIWVHAQNESDLNIHKQLGARGVYIEFDSIGSGNPTDQQYIQKINELVAAGHANRLLLSHDAGWYQPGSPNGGTQRGFNHLIDTFLPALRAQGATEDLITTLTLSNPREAFAMHPLTKSGGEWRKYK